MRPVRSYAGWHRCRAGGGFFLDLRARSMTLSKGDLALLLERLEASLDRSVAEISHVRIRVANLNGPKGGRDKRCSVRIKLNRRTLITVSRSATTVWEALSHTLAACQRRCHEHLARTRTRRGRGRKPLARALA